MHQVTHDQPKADRPWILPYRIEICQLRLQLQLLTVSSSFRITPDYVWNYAQSALEAIFSSPGYRNALKLRFLAVLAT